MAPSSNDGQTGTPLKTRSETTNRVFGEGLSPNLEFGITDDVFLQDGLTIKTCHSA